MRISGCSRRAGPTPSATAPHAPMYTYWDYFRQRWSAARAAHRPPALQRAGAQRLPVAGVDKAVRVREKPSATRRRGWCSRAGVLNEAAWERETLMTPPRGTPRPPLRSSEPSNVGGYQETDNLLRGRHSLNVRIALRAPCACLFLAPRFCPWPMRVRRKPLAPAADQSVSRRRHRRPVSRPRGPGPQRQRACDGANRRRRKRRAGQLHHRAASCSAGGRRAAGRLVPATASDSGVLSARPTA